MAQCVMARFSLRNDFGNREMVQAECGPVD